MKISVQDSRLAKAAEEGVDAFLQVIIDATNEAIGHQLTPETMAELTSDQITLLAWDILHSEVMDGGYVQLIHNGYGAFIFRNPFAKAVKQWGMDDLCRHVRKAGKVYAKHHEEIEHDYTDEEFMALFERMPEFDDFDDEFVEKEETWMAEIAHYVDDNIGNFVTIEK